MTFSLFGLLTFIRPKHVRSTSLGQARFADFIVSSREFGVGLSMKLDWAIFGSGPFQKVGGWGRQSRLESFFVELLVRSIEGSTLIQVSVFPFPKINHSKPTIGIYWFSSWMDERPLLTPIRIDPNLKHPKLLIPLQANPGIFHRPISA